MTTPRRFSTRESGGIESGMKRVNREPRVLLIGAGNMGAALLRGWLASERPAQSVTVVDAAAGARQVAASLGVAVHAAAAPETLAAADVVVLAVKPQQIAEVLRTSASAAEGRLFLSIVAGKRLATLQQGLGAGAAVVRAMPNTPAAVGRGMTVLCAGPGVSLAQRSLCEALMSAVGAVAWLEQETAMDAVTAVSGSGPAYVFLLIEALAQAARDAGLDPTLAQQLALETVAGSAEYAHRAGADAGELRRRVTSPGGTTEAALEILLSPSGGLGDLLTRAVRAAVERSRALD
jgi:pyrroline-5-carboxylate reductase